MSFAWTRERSDKLEALWADGLSASQIAPLLGVTRNSVIGRVHRLRLFRLCGVVKVKRERRQRPNRQAMHSARLRAKALPSPPAPPVPTTAPESLNLTIYQLTDRTCKWPYGDMAPHTYCGSLAVEGKPYCTYHDMLAHAGRGTQRDFDRIASRALGGSLHASKTFVAE